MSDPVRKRDAVHETAPPNADSEPAVREDVPDQVLRLGVSELWLLGCDVVGIALEGARIFRRARER